MNKETAKYLLELLGLDPSEEQLHDTILLHNHLISKMSHDPTLNLENVEPYYIQPARNKQQT